MVRIDQLVGMPVVSVDEGARLGTVRGVELDTVAGRLRYLHVDGAGDRAGGVIPWDSVRSVGADAVTVRSVAELAPTMANAYREHLTPSVGDRPVVTESGERIGRISGYDLNEITGEVECYHVNTGGIVGRLMGREVAFPHSAVRAFGKDAIVVSDEVCRRAAA